ncbi:MAG: hypothetical protein CMN04_05540 [Roseibacillus sp.]|nr:hypothetical protein [Roseibacillus sp.]
MFDILYSHIEPEYKKCYYAYKQSNLQSNLKTDRKTIVHLSFAKFIDKEDFKIRSRNIAFNDYTKRMTSGQPFNVITLVVANDFGSNGKAIEKNLVHLVNSLTKLYNLKIYPSSSIPENIVKKLKEVCWPEDIDRYEPDYMGLLHTILATKKSFGRNLLSVCFDYDYDDSFNQFFKYYHIDIVDDPKEAVLVTDKFIDENRASEIVGLQPNVVISVDDGCIWETPINDAPMGILRKNNIDLISSGITKLGITLVADNHINNLRTVEQTFKLIETTGERVESIWKMVLEKRINFNDIVSEITKAEVSSNRFKLGVHDIGVNTYKA